MARAVCQLQAALLRDAQREFGGDIGQIVRALTAILNDAGSVVGHGRSLFGSEDGGSSSFLARIKHTLAQASTLIATCEGAGRSVDEALAIVEETLAKFREAIAGARRGYGRHHPDRDECGPQGQPSRQPRQRLRGHRQRAQGDRRPGLGGRRAPEARPRRHRTVGQ